MILKVNNGGRVIQGLPAAAILDHEEIPALVADAVSSWREALEGLKEPTRALQVETAKARETTLQVRGERERFEAEVQQKTREEARLVRTAERSLSAAARSLVEALNEHRDEVRKIGARLALAAHVEAVDAMVARQAASARFRVVAPSVPRSDLAALEVPRGMAPVRSASSPLSGLDSLDLVNVPALLEIADAAPVDFGLVVVRSRQGAEFLTTPARAAALTAGGGSWSLVEDDEEASR